MSGAARVPSGIGEGGIYIFPSTSATQRWVRDFMTIFNSHGLSMRAFRGRMLKQAVACMLVKIPVSEEIAQKVLDQMNMLCKTDYALDTVCISLVEVKDMTARPLHGDISVPGSIDIEPFVPDLVPHVQRVMQEHGGRLEVLPDRQIAHFPPGTIKRFIWPAYYNWRYDLFFPDGYCILLAETWNGKKILEFDAKEFP